MSLKVTNQMSFRLMQSEVNNINRRLQDLRQEAATGKRFNKPSDDPSAVRPVLNYSTRIQANQRYQENMGMTHNKLQAQDSHLDHAENTLVRAKQHAIRAINGSLNESDEKILADQVHQMKNELLDTANAQINERFLFSGYEDETQPFQTNDSGVVEYHGDDHAKKVDIAPGEKLEVSIPGRELFLGEEDTNGDGNADTKSGVDAFRTLNNIEALMREDNLPVSGSFGGNYEGWEYEDSNNYDTLSFDLELAGESLTGGSQINVDMSVVGSQDPDKIADKIGSEIVSKTGASGSLANDGDSVTVSNSSGDEVTITRNGNRFDFKTTNEASFQIANFQESSTDDPAGPDLNTDAVMRVSSDPGSKGDAILQNGDSAKISGTDLNEQLGELDEAMTRLRKYRGEMGINMNRVETSIEAKAQAENDLKQILGKYEDADITQTSSQIVQQETALKAALNVSSRMSKISILNYM